MPKVFADIHCHPSMKPYGKSFSSNMPHEQSTDINDVTSTWFKKRPTVLSKSANEFTGLTLFTQSDYQSLQKGNMRFVCTSLYPVEKGFVASTANLGEKLIEFVMGIGLERIHDIQNHNDYYNDVEKEYKFLMQCNGTTFRIGDEICKYITLKSGKEIEKVQEIYANQNVILNVITIEGAHVLNATLLPGKSEEEIETIVLNNVKKLRAWDHRPFFITFAHHFFNGLCGHAKSLHLPLQEKLKIDQKDKLDSEITPLGLKVIDTLLDNSDSKRILIDIKHMSRASRKAYFEIALQKNVPLIASHAGVIGLKNEGGAETITGASKLFVNEDINFYDDEIIAIAKSNGLIGIQLDERRIASSDVLHHTNFVDISYHWEKWAYLLWRQVQHVGDVLDQSEMPAWDITCLGTDFDGLINPIGPYWTAAEMEDMYKHLVAHAKKYLWDKTRKFKVAANKNIDPEKLIDKIMGENAIQFVMRNY